MSYVVCHPLSVQNPTHAAGDAEPWSPPEEAAIVSQHFAYLKQLTEQGVVVLAGRSLNTDASSFGIVILQAHSEEAARDIMHNDPAVQHQVMRAEFYPYRIALAAKAPDAAAEGAP
ncbi:MULTISPECIES: YciI family protein [Aeromonas]|uniref:YciI family protein n=1 Tax=Aeromonas TaxID=642 RepID=UPI0034A5A94A